jgi:hypothetical protein
MHRPSCTSSQLGLITTTRFTPTRLSDIVHPVSLSQLTEARDRVRSFGGYNMMAGEVLHSRKRAKETTINSRRFPPLLYAFDLIELNGDDLRRALEVPKATLASVLTKAGPGLRLNEHLEHDDGETIFATPASSGSKASCRSERPRPTALGARPTGLR